MAGPIPTYLSTQTATQTAFTVPFGLLAFVNAAIATAVAAGEFNVTVDCSLFVTEDVSNLRIYLDSLGYHVDFAKNTNEKSLNIDWGRFLDVPGTEVVVDQGTTPWIVAGTVTALQGTSPWVVSGTITTSPNVNIHDSAGNTLTSTGTSLDVNVTDFPAIQAVSQSGTWTTGRTWTLSSGTDSVNVGNFPATVAVTQSTSPWIISGTVTANAGTGTFLVDGSAHVQPISGTITALQGTSPWVVSGTVITSPDVNIHDSAGNSLSSTGTSLNANITNFPATQNVSVVTSLPAGTNVIGHVITDSGSTTAVTGNVTVVQPTGTNLHAVVDSGAITVNNAGGASAVNIQDGGNSITVDGTVTIMPSGTQDENLIKVAGVTLGATAVTNYGTAPAAVAVPGVNAFITNTPTVNQGTSPWAVSGTVIANAGTGTFQENVAQFGGTNVVTGTGASGAGIPRVTISNDSSLAANQSVNLNQVGGSAITEGQKTMAASVPVVLASDQTGINTFLDKSGSGTITTGSLTVTANTNGCSTIVFGVSGTYTGAVVAEIFDGTTWVVCPAYQPGNPTAGPIIVSTTGTLIVPCGGASQARVIGVFFASGTAVITWTAGSGTNAVQVFNTSTPGALQTLSTRRAANLGVTATGAAGAAVTLTIPAVASNFHYISSLEIVAYTALARVGVAAPVLVTSTNLPGNPVWDFSTAAAIGTLERLNFNFSSPIHSSVLNTNTTIVCPATLSVVWRINVFYYTDI